jgi:double-stranded uracil-DNA glycosylase
VLQREGSLPAGGVYLLAAGRPAAPWGRQPDSLVEDVIDFVAPSPSGLARIPFEEKARRYRELRALLEEER